jgi:hypothetical protein
MTRAGRRVAALRTVAISLVTAAALASCASQPAVPTLDDVADERSRTMTAVWQQAASSARSYIDREWPDAVMPPLTFDRWVEPEILLSEVLECMSRTTGRTVGAIGQDGLLQLRPRPTKEPEWMLPVAQVRCSVAIAPWTGLYPFGGPLEQEWVRHQVTVALPACVRRAGAELVIRDLDAAIDASIYSTSEGIPGAHTARSTALPTQSVWLVAQLTGVDESTARQIRATCPDPGRELVQLGPAEISQ